ncbi:phage protease [Parabacteroides sp. OttesenSCG-928-K15]|nr:phage protease [Parabacteroides sp. OttesenSCG-928-K15]
MAKTKKDPITFILLDESVVTYGFRVLVSGVNLSQIERNPVMFYQHEDYKLPIGRWVNIRKENSQILADAEFDHEDPDPEVKRIIGKVERGFIKMASAGLVEPQFSDESALKIEGQELPTLIQSRMREASIVNIGSCHNAFRLYDKEGKEIDLKDSINLSDIIRPITIQNNSMNELAKLLNLADNASNDDITAAVKLLLKDKKELADKLALKEAAEKEALKAEGVILVDDAIKAGRISAESKESWLKLYDADPEGTKKALGGIPTRRSVTEQINSAAVTNQTELSDLQKKTWDELDRAGQLITLRDNYPDLYKEKFKAKFGNEPG